MTLAVVWRLQQDTSQVSKVTSNDYIHISHTTFDRYVCTYSYIVLLPCQVACIHVLQQPTLTG